MSAPLRVSSGAHTITALAAGYLPARREITLAGQVTETVSLTMLPTEAATAHAAIAVSVPGAAVWINGREVGVTPLPATVAVAPGDASIEVRRPGYLTASRQLRIDNGASARLEITLEEDPAAPATGKGRLRLLLSDPTSSEVTVDGLPALSGTDGLLLPFGPHVVRVRREGFEPYQSTADVSAGRDTALAIAMTPTPETRARTEQSVRGRGVLGWSLVGAGAALVAGAAIYAVVTRGDVGDAQTALDGRLELEAKNIAGNFCYLGPNPMYPGYYEAMRCGDVKVGLQDDLDSAKLRRVLAFSGMGVGAVVAGVGTYLLFTRDSARAAGLGQIAGTPVLNLAFDGTRLVGTATMRF